MASACWKRRETNQQFYNYFNYGDMDTMTTRQQSWQAWIDPTQDATVTVNGQSQQATPGPDGTYRFIIVPRPEHNTIESYIVRSEIIPLRETTES